MVILPWSTLAVPRGLVEVSSSSNTQGLGVLETFIPYPLKRTLSKRHLASTVLAPPVATDMSISAWDLQRQLVRLSASDENYRRLLLELLTHKGLEPYIRSLERPSLRGFIELLDEVRETGIQIHGH